MTNTHWLPPSTKDFAAAKRQFMELYGSTTVMNNYLKVAVLALCAVCLGQTFVSIRIYRLFQDFKPLVIRINELGRAEAVSYASLEYRPQEAELKYFLVQFVEQHYGRIRATVRENYARSLYFLDGPLADKIIEANKKTKLIETFLTDQTAEIEARVTRVAIEDLRQPPYRATVDFEKVYYAADRAERKRDKFTAHFVFTMRDRVPNHLIPVNPLGVTIQYFRDDQAFQ